ncbi:acyltransferase [Pseudomonas sp. 14P_8.1_Bac3]|uniref:acyltransferase family protein n=1 Tax=Pseudomonas sp. 14P_8.1_Bac3 TaxID=2971621 RepID=UPI0021C62D34|nr:acyltransferase [Pseudomonas sp. 14P_8.1_Bac3]MCU1758696.1 acyltransferase [Pseudomonas sp. 14P_8.1_Bac3]
MHRIHSIDYLRGLMALSVLLYHFMSWTIGVPDPSSVIGRLGIYGVSTFYIVSGMSLFIAYKSSTWGVIDIFYFVAKRYLRLIPAFWVACTLLIWMVSVMSPSFEITDDKIISNFTLSFGFTKPGDYLTTGGWSIGNEMVFYAFFPLVMMLPRFRPTLMIISLLLSFSIYWYFAFIKLTPSLDFGDQWYTYIDPMNQAFLFFAGVAIAWVSTTHKLMGNRSNTLILFASIAVFCFYPASGNQINIIYGWTRLAFTAACAACCFAVLNTEFKINEFSKKILYTAGVLSYSLYMFHGIFADFSLQVIAPRLGITTQSKQLALLLLVTLPALILFTYFFFKFVEAPVMSLGRHLKSGKYPAPAT